MKIYQVDAFTTHIFGGNPAAIIPLENWLEDEILQKIALENNLSETAYVRQVGNQFELRWFTPALEVDLCGHATLAAAHVLFKHLGYNKDQIEFQTKSGILTVKRDKSGMIMDFPVDQPKQIVDHSDWTEAYGLEPESVWQGKAYSMAVFKDQQTVAGLNPDQRKLEEMEGIGHIATAKGEELDFVSRFFGPKAGIKEDPVTGSAHCLLIPYWADQLGKTEMQAEQISKRVGKLSCTLAGNRVLIGGQAVTYMIGDIVLP